MNNKLTGLGLSLLIVIPWVLLVDSHYQKGGVHYNYYWVGLVALISNLFYLIPQRKRLIQKIIITLSIGTVLIIVQNLILTPFLVDSICEDRTWILWERLPRLTVNSFHYFFELFAFIAICELLLRKNDITP